jgi:saccharopepsin
MTPPFYSMINQKLIDEPVVSFRIGSSEEDAGEVVFGGIDEAAYKGKIKYAPVRRKAYWEVEFEALKFGDDELKLENTGAAIDTGTSLIVAPSDIAEMLNSMYVQPASHFLRGFADAHYRIGATRGWTGQYTVECDKVSSLPDLVFTFGGSEYPLTSEDYILKVQNTCISGFVGMDLKLPGGELWIIGEFFRANVWDGY